MKDLEQLANEIEAEEKESEFNLFGDAFEGINELKEHQHSS